MMQGREVTDLQRFHSVSHDVAAASRTMQQHRQTAANVSHPAAVAAAAAAALLGTLHIAMLGE